MSDAFLHGMAKHRGFSKFKEKREKAKGVKTAHMAAVLVPEKKMCSIIHAKLKLTMKPASTRLFLHYSYHGDSRVAATICCCRWMKPTNGSEDELA